MTNTIHAALAAAGFGTLNKYGMLKLGRPADHVPGDARSASAYQVRVSGDGADATLDLVTWARGSDGQFAHRVDRSVRVYDVIPEGATLRCYDLGEPTSTIAAEFQIIDGKAYRREGYNGSVAAQSTGWSTFAADLVNGEWVIEQ